MGAKPVSLRIKSASVNGVLESVGLDTGQSKMCSAETEYQHTATGREFRQKNELGDRNPSHDSLQRACSNKQNDTNFF